MVLHCSAVVSLNESCSEGMLQVTASLNVRNFASSL